MTHLVDLGDPTTAQVVHDALLRAATQQRKAAEQFATTVLRGELPTTDLRTPSLRVTRMLGAAGVLEDAAARVLDPLPATPAATQLRLPPAAGAGPVSTAPGPAPAATQPLRLPPFPGDPDRPPRPTPPPAVPPAADADVDDRAAATLANLRAAAAAGVQVAGLADSELEEAAAEAAVIASLET